VNWGKKKLKGRINAYASINFLVENKQNTKNSAQAEDFKH